MFEALKRRKTLRDYFLKLGPALQHREGWQVHYKPSQVLRMASDLGLSPAYLWYAYAIYCTQEDFDAHRAQTGERCDYEALRSELSAGRYGRGTEYDPTPLTDHGSSADHGYSSPWSDGIDSFDSGGDSGAGDGGGGGE